MCYLFNTLVIIVMKLLLLLQAVDADVEATISQRFIVIMKTITNVRSVRKSILSSFRPETYNITHKYNYLMNGINRHISYNSLIHYRASAVFSFYDAHTFTHK